MQSIRRWRGATLVGAGAMVLSVLAGCGSSSDDNDASSESSAAAGAYPVTLEHKFGSTTIESKPTRVAVVGYSDQDFVLAFGTTPVMVREWYGPDKGIQPWSEEYVEGDEPVVENLGSDAIDVEKVASYEPDLIVGVYSGMTEEDYKSLSQLAPVVAPRAGYIDYGQPWQEVTEDIGTALGQKEQALELVKTITDQAAAVKAAHPNWEGKTAAIATFDGIQTSVFASEDARSRFITSLGFTIPERFDELAGEQFYTPISLENAKEIDQDVLIWDQLSFAPNGRASVEATPALSALSAARENRTVFLEPVALEEAFGWQTVLSIPYALEGITPLLEAAITE